MAQTTAEQAQQARAFAEMRAAVARLKEIAARLPEKRESVAGAVARWLDEAA